MIIVHMYLLQKMLLEEIIIIKKAFNLRIYLRVILKYFPQKLTEKLTVYKKKYHVKKLQKEPL